MHASRASSGFPVHRTRVVSGAGDEESFETKDSPPAVAGPLTSGNLHRPRPARLAEPRAAEGPHRIRTGTPPILIDLVTGAETLDASLDLLSAAALDHVAGTAGSDVGCGVVLRQHKRSPAVTGTSDQVVTLLHWEQETAEGPVVDVLSGAHPVAVLQRNGDFRWQQYSSQLQVAGFGSALAIRLRLDTGLGGAAGSAPASDPGQATAALAFFAQDEKAFPLQVIAEARSFAILAARSLQMAIDMHTARSLATDLRSALDSRTSINVACGVIMAQNRCSYQEAFAILAKASSHRNVKVRQVAEDILAGLPEGVPNPHFSR
ncbi:MAG: ANTAR domain-containing protein [Pseudarthrobacter sp.]|nr:ANTAR domain-containing protein [Pseudarthrobacter sp.]